MKHSLTLIAVPRGPTHQTSRSKVDDGEKDSEQVSVGGSVIPVIIPEPLTPYPYIATAFFTVIFG